MLCLWLVVQACMSCTGSRLDGTGYSVHVGGKDDRVVLIRGSANREGAPGRRNHVDACTSVEEFLEKHAVFGEGTPPLLEHVDEERDHMDPTLVHVSYQQYHEGVPVHGAVVRAGVREGHVAHVAHSTATIAPDINMVPSLEASDVAHVLREHARLMLETPRPGGKVLREDVLELQSAGVTSRTPLVVEGPPRVVVYPGKPRGAVLAYAVRARAGPWSREVFLDARSGEVLDSMPFERGIFHAKITNITKNGTVLWDSDSGATPAGEVGEMALGARYAFALMKNCFGLDSWDNNGTEMHAVYNSEDVGCPNANFDGQKTNFCPGVASVETVAHEWGHAYTQGGPNSTHGLMYAYQSGALNEAFSDVTSMAVMLTFALNDSWPLAPRALGACSVYQGANSVDGGTKLALSTKGLPPFASFELSPSDDTLWANLSFPLKLGKDSSKLKSMELCGPSTVDLTGSIAVVERGTCTFVMKAYNALSGGAEAMLIIDYETSDAPIKPGGFEEIPFPVAMVSYTSGLLLRGAVDHAISGTPIIASSGGGAFARPTEDSRRWVLGIDDPAFGGPIRDMWTPQCFGDPHVVSADLYHCSKSDSGGVHTNSAIANRLFAVLVDGSPAENVTAIGVQKAYHIIGRTAFTYQTPLTDFRAHAAGLLASCSDLLGIALPDLKTGETSERSQILQADCDALQNAISACELEESPACVFKPLLTSGEPQTCNSTSTVSMWSAAGSELSSWVASEAPAPKAVSGWTKWILTDDPEDGEGSRWFAADPPVGTCAEGDDRSGVVSLTTPVIPLHSVSPHQLLTVRIRHSVALEPNFDGGVVRVRFNNGAWRVPPPSDYLFNGPVRLTGPPHNTNPLAGEYAFTGTDEGQATGSWGTSVLVLRTTGGEGPLQLRFEMGTDGCNGRIGWAVAGIDVGTCDGTCGDGICFTDENVRTCPAECGEAEQCGDGVCSGPDDCEADCCGDGICSPWEVCPLDCCGALPDCSFESPSGWSFSADVPEMTYDSVIVEGTQWQSGSAGLVLSGYLEESAVQSTAAVTVSTHLASPVDTQAELSFYVYGHCYKDYRVRALVNSAVVWEEVGTEGVGSPSCRLPTVNRSHFHQVRITTQVKAGLNSLAFSSTASSAKFYIDHVQVTLEVPAPPEESAKSTHIVMFFVGFALACCCLASLFTLREHRAGRLLLFKGDQGQPISFFDMDMDTGSESGFDDIGAL